MTALATSDIFFETDPLPTGTRGRIHGVINDTVVQLPAGSNARVHGRFVLTSHAPAVQATGAQARFIQLADRWETETQYMSSLQSKLRHDDYLKIIAMGPSVLPMILQRMGTKPNYWFLALRSLTDCDPVREDHRGDMWAMTQDWLGWGKLHGYTR